MKWMGLDIGKTARATSDGCQGGEAGGVTILVVLSLLALLTIMALGMSKNAMREIRTSGFQRQGSMARNVADSGIHWAIYWIDQADSSDVTAKKFISVKKMLARNNQLSGKTWSINATEYRPGSPIPADGLWVPPPSSSPDFVTGAEPDYTQGFSVGLMRMGKLPVSNMSQGAGAGAFAPAAGGTMLQAPDLWALRSDAQIQPVNARITFAHAKEAWISTPVR